MEKVANATTTPLSFEQTRPISHPGGVTQKKKTRNPAQKSCVYPLTGTPRVSWWGGLAFYKYYTRNRADRVCVDTGRLVVGKAKAHSHACMSVDNDSDCGKMSTHHAYACSNTTRRPRPFPLYPMHTTADKVTAVNPWQTDDWLNKFGTLHSTTNERH